MLPFFSKQSDAPLTDNEKLMIINAHNYLSKVNFSEESHLKSTLLKKVAEALGVAESTIRCIVADWNKCNDELLRTKILNFNKIAKQVSTPVLCQFFSENGYTFSKWKLLQVFHHLGYYYGQGERRNILHELPNNVAFHCRYLRFHFANLEGQNDVSHYPEVFLDESYCHLHHILRNTWVPHQGVVLSPGHGLLVEQLLYSEMVSVTNYMVNWFQTLFIFGIQELNHQEIGDEKEAMLKNKMMFPILSKMPILFQIR
ncbi:unnamed protein product [Rhizophagus irregularis]|nr:unnamed protein product [Rhizophagus irregularis]